MCDQQSLRSACAYAHSDQSLCLSLEYSMSVKLLTEHFLEVLSYTCQNVNFLEISCRGSNVKLNAVKRCSQESLQIFIQSMFDRIRVMYHHGNGLINKFFLFIFLDWVVEMTITFIRHLLKD